MNKINLQNKTVFITGSAGFIGSNLVLELLRKQSPISCSCYCYFHYISPIY